MSTLNGVLHDLDAPYLFPILDTPSPFNNPQIPNVAYTWVQWVGSYLNTFAVTATVSAIVVLAWRLPQGLPADSDRS